jgi:hypothetical protein
MVFCSGEGGSPSIQLSALTYLAFWRKRYRRSQTCRSPTTREVLQAYDLRLRSHFQNSKIAKMHNFLILSRKWEYLVLRVIQPYAENWTDGSPQSTEKLRNSLTLTLFSFTNFNLWIALGLKKLFLNLSINTLKTQNVSQNVSLQNLTIIPRRCRHDIDLCCAHYWSRCPSHIIAPSSLLCLSSYRWRPCDSFGIRAESR